MISEGTKNQLKYTERCQKQIGIRRDYRSSISEGEFPVYIKYTGNEDYWDKKEQIVLNQSEFNSVGLGFMHYMSPELSYDKLPYKVSKVWVDIGGENKVPMIGVQQIYFDTIKCKLIGTPEEIEGVRLHKRYEEEEFDIEDELAKIRGYSTNEWFHAKEQIVQLSSGEETRLTTIDDYDIEYEIKTTWKDFRKGLIQSKRVRYLEEQLAKIERITDDMSIIEKRIYRILGEEYGVDSFDIDERYLLAEKPPYGKSIAEKIAEDFETHPAEVWKAYWICVEPWVKKELEWLEKHL